MTTTPSDRTEKIARIICEHLLGPHTWDRPEESGSRNLCLGAAAAILASVPDQGEGRTPARETFWLIERKGHGQWIDNHSFSAFYNLTNDVWHAHRYETEYAAHERWRYLSANDRMAYAVTEHIYINKIEDAAPPVQTPNVDIIAAAFEAGAMAVHDEWVAASKIGRPHPTRGDPEFTEAANDYARSVVQTPVQVSGTPELFVVRKRGYFYRPNAEGYTSNIDEAGKWIKSEADLYAAKSEGVTVHRASDFPKPNYFQPTPPQGDSGTKSGGANVEDQFREADRLKAIITDVCRKHAMNLTENNRGIIARAIAFGGTKSGSER